MDKVQLLQFCEKHKERAGELNEIFEKIRAGKENPGFLKYLEGKAWLICSLYGIDAVQFIEFEKGGKIE